MKSLKQILTLNNISNNTYKENEEIIDKVLDLRKKCGCLKYSIENNKLQKNKKKCIYCNKITCNGSMLFDFCLNCAKKYCRNIKHGGGYINFIFNIEGIKRIRCMRANKHIYGNTLITFNEMIKLIDKHE